jgi:hypothetical protein
MRRGFLGTLIILGISCLSAAPFAQKVEGPKRDLLVNNRVLARPVGKTITMMDVVKRLDMFFYRTYPELAHSPEARYEFYVMHWRQALDEMINSALILADAEEKKVPIHDGDIRKEMEQNFGPQVVDTIDKMGLTFDEVWEMTRTELIVRQMNGYMVHSKAISTIGPGRLMDAYNRYSDQQGETGIWRYRVLSIRDASEERGREAAAVAYEALANGSSLDEAVALLSVMQGEGEISSATKISLSELFERKAVEMAEAHRDALANLQSGCYSQPIGQTSRIDRSTVYRIFYVETFDDPGLTPFETLQKDLQSELFVEEATKAEQLYIAKLRRRYGIDEDYLSQNVPADFVPVSIR